MNQTTKVHANRLTYALLGILAAIVVMAALFWDAIPGTYHQNSSGMAKGTGTARYFYEDDSLMIVEHYFRGLIQQAIWYKPDGTIIATESYDKKSGGKGYYLRQDGTIKSQVAYRFDPETNSYVGVGKVIYYDRNGSPDPNLAKAID